MDISKVLLQLNLIEVCWRLHGVISAHVMIVFWSEDLPGLFQLFIVIIHVITIKSCNYCSYLARSLSGQLRFLCEDQDLFIVINPDGTATTILTILVQWMDVLRRSLGWSFGTFSSSVWCPLSLPFGAPQHFYWEHYNLRPCQLT